MATVPAWFDYKAYFQNKLAKLGDSWNDLTAKKAFSDAGYEYNAEGLYQHFVDFGNDEGVSPNALFNESEYLVAKTAQFLNKSVVTADEVKEVASIIANAGMSAWDHYLAYGSNEGVNPSNGFDESVYLDNKLDQWNATSGETHTMDELKAALADNGLTPLTHYLAYGKAEGLSATAVTNGPSAGSETFRLTADDDDITGTAGDDIFIGKVGTLGDGDVIDGGKGDDTLYAYLNSSRGDGDLTGLTPEISNVENVIFQVQHASGTLVGNNTDAHVDAGDISGMTYLGNNESRDSLTVEDVRTNSNELTIGLSDTDPGDIDFTVTFDNQHLKANSSTSSGSLALELMDTNGKAVHDKPLLDNAYNVVTFHFNSKQYVVTFDVVKGDATYEDLKDAIQTAINANEELVGKINVDLGSDFIKFDGNTGKQVTGQQVVLSTAPGVDGSFTIDQPSGDGWSATGTLPPTNSLAATMTPASDSSCPLITTNIELDNVGRVQWDDASACLPDNAIYGSQAGDMVVGAMGTRGGVERFDVTVDEGSWLSSLSSTNNALRMVTVKNGDVQGDSDTMNAKGNLFIGDTLAENLDGSDGKDMGIWQNAPRLLDTDGLTDVAVFDASAMEGKVNIGAQLTAASYEKYLSSIDGGTTDKLAPLDGYDRTFTYNLGSNDDTLNMVINGGVAADVDFKYVANAGKGNDLINFRFDGMTNFQFQNQVALDNVTLNGGEGADKIWTWGSESGNANDANLYAGAVKINGGEGNDVVYAAQNNDDQNAVWVLNSDIAGAARAIKVSAVHGAQPLSNDVLGTQGEFGYTGAAAGQAITVTVNFQGIAKTVTIATATETAGTLTAEQINKAIITAIEGDDRLSNLLVAKDGAGHSLLIESLIDGDMTGALTFTFDGATITDATPYTGANTFATLNELTLASSATTTQGDASTAEVQTLDLSAVVGDLAIGDVLTITYDGVEYTSAALTAATAADVATKLAAATDAAGNALSTVTGVTEASNTLTLTAVNDGAKLDGTVLAKVHGEATGTDNGTNSANTITGGAGDDLIVLGAHATNNMDDVVLGNHAANGIDTIVNFDNADQLVFNAAITGATKITSAATTLNELLSAITANEMAVNAAVTFDFKGEAYVVLDSGTAAGYQAGEDAVVKLAGLEADDVVAMGDIFA